MIGRSPGWLLLCSLLAGALPAGAVDVDPTAGKPPNTVYLVPGSHLDLGYTAPIASIRAQRIQLIDDAIEMAGRDPGFVWFEEAGWTVDAWLDEHQEDPARISRLRALVQERRFGIGALLLSGYPAAFPEGLPLLTMHLDRIEAELGVRPDVAVVNDVPSVPSSFRDALVRAGVSRLLMGPNEVFTPPLPEPLSRRPFRWTSPEGGYVDVFVDPDNVSAGYERWGLPPACARLFQPERFGITTSDDEVLARGVAHGEARVLAAGADLVVQHAFDNWDTSCAQGLPDAVRRWNQISKRVQVRLALPSAYFNALPAPPVRHGEWAMDWDVIRASEPVWTWRLRQAMAAVDATTPRAARRSLAESMEHNVGIGPRWAPQLGMAQATRHVAGVEALYRAAVTSVLGPAAADALPGPLPRPAAGPWPAEWAAWLGPHDEVARLRAGSAPLSSMVAPLDSTWPAPVVVEADPGRLVARTHVDRIAVGKALGSRHRVVLEMAIRQPRSALALSLVGNADAERHGWLTGRVPEAVVSPAGVVVRGADGLAIRARGPLVLAWGLQADARDPSLTWLQALVVLNATHAEVGHQPVRLPFEELYPGEPAQFDVEIELERIQ